MSEDYLFERIDAQHRPEEVRLPVLAGDGMACRNACSDAGEARTDASDRQSGSSLPPTSIIEASGADGIENRSIVPIHFRRTQQREKRRNLLRWRRAPSPPSSPASRRMRGEGQGEHRQRSLRFLPPVTNAEVGPFNQKSCPLSLRIRAQDKGASGRGAEAWLDRVPQY
jgi:hypothetical protein